jgi:hypothetical protein
MVFVLFVLWLTTSGYSRWLLWSLFCLSSDLPLLVTPFDSYGLCFVCPLTYHFWLLPLIIMVFVLFVLWFTTSGYSFDSYGLCFVCPLTYHLWLLPLTLVVFVLLVSDLPLLVTPFDSCGLCFDCLLIYQFWLLPLILMVFVLFVLWLTTSCYSLWLLWSLLCLSSDLPLLVTPFDSCGLCFVCPLTYHFWLLPLTLMVFVLFVLWLVKSKKITDSDYPFGIPRIFLFIILIQNCTFWIIRFLILWCILIKKYNHFEDKKVKGSTVSLI